MKRDLLTINDLTREDVQKIFSLTTQLKQTNDPSILKDKVIGLVFNKPSTRTRVSFESGILRLGGHSLVLNFADLQVGRGETLADTAKVLSRFLDAIVIRTYDHEDIAVLAKNATIPLINGLSDLYHPCQVLTDLYTILEKKGSLDGIKVAYIGDANNNMANSWIIGAALLGINLSLCCPKEYSPGTEVINIIEDNSNISVHHHIDEGVAGADILYTDVWVSMGQDAEKEERLSILKDYQVNQSLLDKANKNCLVMHCLPAHREEEISAEVIDGPASIVFDQAENRMHVQKGILAFLLSK